MTFELHGSPDLREFPSFGEYNLPHFDIRGETCQINNTYEWTKDIWKESNNKSENRCS